MPIAIKDGVTADFTRAEWNDLPTDKDGWVMVKSENKQEQQALTAIPTDVLPEMERRAKNIQEVQKGRVFENTREKVRDLKNKK